MADAEPHDVEEPLGMTNTALRALGVLVMLALIGFWAWIFTGGPKKTNPDRLDDRTYVTFAQKRCTQLTNEIAMLPNARDEKTAVDRANTLDKANARVSAMVDDLAARAPNSGDDKVRLDGWITDWRTYAKDRATYAKALRTDPRATFVVTPHPDFNDGVDEVIRVFADVNDMPECRVPGDVG